MKSLSENPAASEHCHDNKFDAFMRFLEVKGEKIVSYNLFTLKFRSNENDFESNFINDYIIRFKEHIRICHLFALMFYLVWGLLDHLLYPQFYEKYILVRVSISAIFFIGYLFSFKEAYIVKQQYLAFFYCVITGSGFIYMVAIAPVETAWLNFIGIIICLIFGYTFIRSRIIAATLSGLTLFVIYVVTMLQIKSAESVFLTITIFTLVLTNILGIIICYITEFTARKNYILNYLIDRERSRTKQANEKLKVLNKHLKKLSYLDGLTQIANRRLFDERLESDYMRAARSTVSLTLIMIDIDYFKLYNDYYGHQAGDKCLKQVAQVIDSNCRRSNDFAARYGGEEFGVILFDAGADDAEKLGKKIQNNLADLSIKHEKSQVSDLVTISVGIASIIPDPSNSIGNLVESADQALYHAKSIGRNCIKVYKPDKSPNHS
jgi:diguanylate cyclase (GGDEF)-like protein